MKPTLLVLAAGMGSRYGGLKQLDQVGPSGETIMEYSVFDAVRSGFGKVVFVIRKDIEKEFRELFGNRFSQHIAVDFVFQELNNVPDGIVISPERAKPWGTAHAVLTASQAIDEPFAVINADDFYGYGTFRALAGHLTAASFKGSMEYCLAGFTLENTLSEFGTVSRGVCQADKNHYLISIEERKNIRAEKNGIFCSNEDGKDIPLGPKLFVSMNAWAFGNEVFSHLENQFREFIQRNSSDLKAEFYLPSFADNLIRNQIARFRILPVSEKWFGVTYREDKPIVEENLRKLTRLGIYPEQLWG